MATVKEWFSEWFDSPYYHVLYQNRDENEAQFFLDHVVQKLRITPDMHLADLACGKGRHAIYLNKIGFQVSGYDLSASSISQAQPYSNSRLRFFVQDLRTLHVQESIDIALNLFTSFGYFKNEEENHVVLQNIHRMLRKDGLLLIDFLNTHTTLANLVESESKRIGEIQFHIRRWYDQQFLYKKISLKDGENQFEFVEQVQLIDDISFTRLLNDAGFDIIDKMGDYKLSPFRKSSSERLLLLAQKR